MNIKNLLRPLVPDWLIDIYHLKMGILAALINGLPARKIKVVGITGTNGKTTTAYLVHHILQSTGEKSALASTVAFAIGNKFARNNQKMTTMSPFALQNFLKNAVKEKCKFAIIEVTSHGLMQHRVWGINFDTAVLTNITHDHLDYHKTKENYKQAKLKLFANNPKLSVINADDKSAEDFLKLPAEKQLTYSVNGRADLTARKILFEPTSTTFTAVTPEGQATIEINLPGEFNISNALAASAVALGQDIKIEAVAEALNKFEGVPGRMEKIKAGQEYDVIIDYAHTPDAFEKIFKAVKNGLRGRIIHVFGSTGARDKTKRPILGALSANNADISIITDDDPYHEPPMDIINQVYDGAVRNKKSKSGHGSQVIAHSIPLSPKSQDQPAIIKIQDRRLAIRKALELAERNDLVLITGKGHEQVMAVADPRKGPEGFKLIPWDERKIVKEELLRSRSSDPVSEISVA